MKHFAFASAFAVMALSATAFTTVAASAAEPFRVCTGGEDGNYEYVGQKVQEQLRGVSDVVVVNTAGSWENLQKIRSGECDAAMVQSDALYLWSKNEGDLRYTNLSTMYTEYAHLLCNRKSPVDEFGSLNAETKIFSGAPGSGADVTLRGLIKADEENGGSDYTKVPLLNELDADIALLKVKARKNGADCLFYVGSRGNKFMTVNAEQVSDFVHLVPIVDKDFDDVTVTDSDGNTLSVWSKVEMPSDTYGEIMPDGTVWGNSSLNTIGVTANFIVSDAWAENPENKNAFKTISFNIENVANIVRSDRKVELVD